MRQLTLLLRSSSGVVYIWFGGRRRNGVADTDAIGETDLLDMLSRARAVARERAFAGRQAGRAADIIDATLITALSE